MNPKEKLIIEKLLALANKQQKVLTKLAQANMQRAEDVEGNTKYLQRAWLTTVVNTGAFQGRTPDVKYTPSTNANDGVVIEGNYMVSGEVPVQYREKFERQFRSIIDSQKPELDGKVSVMFTDPV